jgi:hypothetical protein
MREKIKLNVLIEVDAKYLFGSECGGSVPYHLADEEDVKRVVKNEIEINTEKVYVKSINVISEEPEGSVKASCGHWLTKEEESGSPSLGYPCSIMSFARDGSRAVDFLSACGKCFNRYGEIGIRLENRQEERDWMCGRTDYPDNEEEE